METGPRLAFSGWYRAGSRQPLPFSAPPVHHTGSDVHCGCPRAPWLVLWELALPLEAPVKRGQPWAGPLSHQDSYSAKGNSLSWSTRDAGRTAVCPGGLAQTHSLKAVDILCCFPTRTESPPPPTSLHSVMVKNENIVRNRRGQDGPLFYLFDLKPGCQPPDLPS